MHMHVFACLFVCLSLSLLLFCTLYTSVCVLSKTVGCIPAPRSAEDWIGERDDGFTESPKLKWDWSLTKCHVQLPCLFRFSKPWMWTIWFLRIKLSRSHSLTRQMVSLVTGTRSNGKPMGVGWCRTIFWPPNSTQDFYILCGVSRYLDWKCYKET